jgi:3',5'-cyclic-AMP phosphodiesterase
MKRRQFLGSGILAAVAPELWAAETATPNLAVDMLLATPPRKRLFRVAHLTDTHVQADKISEEGLARALKSVQNLNAKPDFIINGGDAIMDALDRPKDNVKQQFAIWKKILEENNTLPVQNIIGNHDVFGWFSKTTDFKGDRLYGKQWAVEEFKMPRRYYSFDKGLWKFIVLDSTQLNANGGYIAYIDQEQYEWLETELNKTPAAQFVCIASHIPILSVVSSMFFNKNEPNGDLLVKRNLMHTDSAKLRALFKKHRQVRTVISGHIHMVDEVLFQGVRYFCNGAVCGNWWKGSFQDFPPAYAVLDFYDDGSTERFMMNY